MEDTKVDGQSGSHIPITSKLKNNLKKHQKFFRKYVLLLKKKSYNEKNTIYKTKIETSAEIMFT